MYQLQGFATNSALDNNLINAIAQFGELSTESQTSVKDTATFTRPDTCPGTDVVAFTLSDGAGGRPVPSSGFIDTIVGMGYFVYQQYAAGAIPLNTLAANFIATLGTQFPSISNIHIGQLINSGTPTFNCPDYVLFNITDGSNQYGVQLWFSDAAFQTQYQGYTIEVLPPVSDLSVFEGHIGPVITAMGLIGTGQIVTQINAAVADKPATTVMSTTVRWFDPTNPASFVDTVWTTVHWGKAGLDQGAINAAIVDYLNANQPEDNWPIIFPSLFNTNEFVLIPMWKNIAAPETSLNFGIYSPAVTLGQIGTVSNLYLPAAYTGITGAAAFLAANLQAVGVPYRSVILLVCGNPSNAGGVTKFTNVYPDYIDVSTGGSDFARMDSNTRAFVTTLADAMSVADTLLTGSVPPSPYSRVQRGGNTYLMFTLNGYNWLILLNSSYS